MLDLGECIEKGLIRKIPASKEQSLLCLEKALDTLKDAEANLKESRFNSAALLAYVAMLNMARAVLFRDGYREKSHYCVVKYLEGKYGKEFGGGELRKLDSYRQTRHEVQYSAMHNATESEAGGMVEFGWEFLGKIEDVLEGKNN